MSFFFYFELPALDFFQCPYLLSFLILRIKEKMDFLKKLPGCSAGGDFYLNCCPIFKKKITSILSTVNSHAELELDGLVLQGNTSLNALFHRCSLTDPKKPQKGLKNNKSSEQNWPYTEQICDNWPFHKAIFLQVDNW